MRIEPPPSLACAIGTMPAATAAAEPPLEPPVECVEVPRVVAGAVEHRLGGRQQAELGDVGLAERHQAGGLEARHQRIVLRRRQVDA